jgi:glycosidase
MMHRHPAAMSLLSALLALCCAFAMPASRAAAGDMMAASTHPQASSGVWYEIFVRSWYDTNGDGIGDLNGVTAKLDYLQSLGVSGIWLMPINPSPSYHGYDITDYYGINPQYGTMADFEHLLAEAHKRHIKVIIDLVINHSSDQHPWFKAAQDPHSPYHDWYSWSNAATNLQAISATGSPAWHATPDGQHYLGVFTSSMPDLDFDTPAVRHEMIKIGQYWLKKGVDGFRLDAAQHIYYDFKSQRNDPAILQKNLAWWTAFRHGIDAIKPGTYVVGEVTRDDPDELAAYFRPLSAAFDFPLAKQLIDSAQKERADGLGKLLERTNALYRKASGKSGVDAPFLSNHDQERVISQLDGNAQHMRMAAAMLLTLPGQPFVYYGEELGVQGRKPDEDLRQPMRWYRDPHGKGETSWETLGKSDGPEISVEAEQRHHGSLLQFYTMLIDWRRQLGVLRDGRLHDHPFKRPQLVGWELDDAQGHVLVLHNLSGVAQAIDMKSESMRRFTRLRLQSQPNIVIANGKLQMPAYSTAILH